MALHSLKRNEMLEKTLKMSGRVADGNNPTTTQYSDASEIINSVCSDLMNEGQPLIQLELKSKTVTAKTFDLDIEDEDILTMYIQDSGSDDTPMKKLSYNEYYGGISDKDNSGTPYEYYVDYQGTRKVYLYPVPTSETIKYLVIKRFEDLGPNDVIPLDNRYYLYLMYEVAHILCDLYVTDIERSAWLASQAKHYGKKVKGKDKKRYSSFKRGTYS